MDAAVYTVTLFTAAAVAQSILFVLLLLSARRSLIKALLLGLCASSAGGAIAAALGLHDVLSPHGLLIELATVGSWCGFILYLLSKQASSTSHTFQFVIIAGIAVALVIVSAAGLVPSLRQDQYVATFAIYARLGLSVIGLLATENFYRNTDPESRWHINLLCVGLTGLFVYTIVLYADALLFRRVSEVLWAGRAVVLVAAVPLFAVTAARNPKWAINIHVSRGVVFHTTALMGSGIFLLALAATGEVFRAVGPGWGDVAEMTLVIGGAAVVGALSTSGSARSRLRRLLAENFFSHRYDYRAEWLKSIEILSGGLRPDTVQTRIIKAIAGVADSPAGVLWVRDLDGAAFHWAASWNLPAVGCAEPADGAFVALFQQGEWVLELDQCEGRPTWLEDIIGAWLAVPLAQKEQVIGFVVLSRPRAPLKVDGETFDLLRIVASQAAIHLAEQQIAKALAEAEEFRDFGKRFAFIAHDLKNVTSELGMILQNARHHSGDPEFQEDVLATVQAALERIKKLLKTLRSREDPLGSSGIIVPVDLLKQQVSAIRGSRGLIISLDDDGRSGAVAMDAGAFRSVIAHLCDNAIDAADGQVRILIRHEQMRIEIDICDNGAGMSAEFIRDELFQPFGSTKREGMGIGAYQARELVRAAGGDLIATSRPGAGTTMRILLPCVGLNFGQAVALGVEGMQ